MRKCGTAFRMPPMETIVAELGSAVWYEDLFYPFDHQNSNPRHCSCLSLCGGALLRRSRFPQGDLSMALLVTPFVIR